ncbi:MAG: FAD-dependent oxidoreductase [Leptolyngbya sp. Prado105]|jgi:selenide,water dikinase|nr:FAD-dependent oxidoreductase [Leptolyngbya sp. Prado105]
MKKLVLIGGGHSHAIALRQFGLHPVSQVEITLISEAEDTPYSGMLPGHVAGLYSYDACHIDLRSLCEFAKARLIVDRAVGLDLAQHRVLCEQADVAFDLLSIDIGSTPTMPAGAQGIGAKPISRFLKWWDRFEGESLAIVGGGTGGVELALNMQRRFPDLRIQIFQRDRELLPTHHAWVRRQFEKILAERGIQVHLGQTVQQTTCDATVWVTQASAAPWLKQSGLNVDERGFILVNDFLQSVSHPEVFAAGDIVTMIHYARPKAGVFAVRQGKPLFHNLGAVLEGRALKPYRPQKRYLSLIGTGDEMAIASYGIFGWRSRWLWRVKDWIDRAFMNQFKGV